MNEAPQDEAQSQDLGIANVPYIITLIMIFGWQGAFQANLLFSHSSTERKNSKLFPPTPETVGPSINN